MLSDTEILVKNMTDTSDIALCFETYQELRPHLTDRLLFTQQVKHQQDEEGFHLSAIQEQNSIVACVGYRIMTTLAWGKIVYIDDLITRASCRGRGFGGRLLEHVDAFAKENGCVQVHLDSGYQRNAAHRVYLNHGFELACHHFAKKL